ncbi:MAG: CarD family transcriptional regulator [Synergistaceae bacterium]|jgi:CarD family transcriptional regulator|nr:CarD family transcriptional regulator [Synergistaceae bacterium]
MDMYQVGDLVVYGGSSCVCRVAEVAGLDFVTDKSRLYYILKPLHQEGVIYNPVDNTDVFMRPVITKDEAENLIDMIPRMRAEPYLDEPQQVGLDYESILKTHDCTKLIELTMSIYAKKQFLLENKRKFGSQEDNFMKRAEDMLFGELAAALDIPKEQVRKYIAERANGKPRSDA